MGGAARSGNNDLKTARFSRRTQLSGQSGCAMSGDDPAFMRHTKLGKSLIRMTHRIPVGLAAHDDSHEGRPGVRNRASPMDGDTTTRRHGCVLCRVFAVLYGLATSTFSRHMPFCASPLSPSLPSSCTLI